jgi:hypothetical protein
MKCPHCDKEIPGSLCPKCGETVYEDATYCMSCATPLKESAPPVSRDESFFDDEEDIDFDDRELCSDGTCTGIMVDGRCTECGKAPGEVEAPKAEAEETVTKEQTAEAETDEPVKEKDA